MFQSHMRFYVTQWSVTRFYGSLSVYSRPLPSEKISPHGSPIEVGLVLRRLCPAHEVKAKKSKSFQIKLEKAFYTEAYNGSGSLLLKNEPMKLWPLHCEPPSLRC